MSHRAGASLRSDLDGPHRRQLRRPRRRAAVRRRQGEAARLRVRVARLDPARAALPRRPPVRRHRGRASTRACSCSASRPRRGGCRSCPPASASAPTSSRDNARDRARSRRPTTTARSCVAVPALTLDAAFVHMNRADARGNGQYLGPDPYMDDLFLGAAERRFLSRRADRRHRGPRQGGPAAVAADQPAARRRRGRGAQRRPLHLVRSRTTPATRRSRRSTPRRPSRPRRGPSSGRRGSTSSEAEYQARLRPTEAHVTDQLSGLVDARRRVRRRRGRVLPRRRRDPRQPDRHHPDDRRPPGPRHLRARPGHDRRRGAAHRQRRGVRVARAARSSSTATRTGRCSTGCGTAAAT